MTVLVTGGCGFIGSHFVMDWLEKQEERLVNIDALTYAANRPVSTICAPGYHFIQADLCDTPSLVKILSEYTPRAIIHFAAESHVDRSIDYPNYFVDSNIVGMSSLLSAVKTYLSGATNRSKHHFKLVNVSTDEVYGALSHEESKFSEHSPLKPNSPYSASKASADLLARSFYKTYDLPVITTRSTNNFGPFQNREKFIPSILEAIHSKNNIAIYGDGRQIRSWIHVSDHIAALNLILEYGEPGSVFNIGSDDELENIKLAEMICLKYADHTNTDPSQYLDLIEHVDDRKAHDFRYAVNSEAIRKLTGWYPRLSFDDAIDETILSFLDGRSIKSRLGELSA